MLDLFLKGLLDTAIGMGTVFAVLIGMAFIIHCFKYVNRFEAYLKDRKKKSINEINIQNISVEEVNYMDDAELVAVITAAIAATLNTSYDKLQVKSIRKAREHSRWHRA